MDISEEDVTLSPEQTFIRDRDELLNLNVVKKSFLQCGIKPTTSLLVTVEASYFVDETK